MSLLGIDVGTSGCKAAVFSEEGQLLALAYEEYDYQHPQPGRAELDSRQVWESAQRTIVQVAQQQQRAIALFRELGDKKGLISTLPTTSLATCPAANETVFVVVRSPGQSAWRTVKSRLCATLDPKRAAPPCT